MAGKSRQKIYKGMTHKRCPKCGKVKPLNEFHKHAGHLDGRASRCIPCRKEDKRAYYYANREHDNQKSREWRRNNPERIIENHRRDSQRHPHHHKARSAVNSAIRRGRLPRANSLICTKCGKKQAIHYHHHLGYAPKHYLDVIPLCEDCHTD